MFFQAPSPTEVINFILIDVFFILLCTASIKTKTIDFKSNIDVLGIKESNKIKGFLAVLIILHHLSITITTGIVFKILSVVGIISVAIFFFYSGYGLMLNYIKRENYLDNFIKKRLLKIIIPYGLAIFITYLGHLLIKYKFTPSEIFLSLIDGDPVVKYSWYVLAIIVLYVVFYLSGKLFKNPKIMLVAILVGIFVYTSAAINLSSWGNWTINSCLTFFVGCLFAYYSDKLKKYLNFNKKLNKILITGLMLSAITVLLTFLTSGYSIRAFTDHPAEFSNYIMTLPTSFIATNIICVISIIYMAWIFGKVHLSDKIFAFLGNISFEIYLYHGLIMILLRNDFFSINIDVLYAIFTLLLSIALAYFMNKITKVIYKKLKL